MRFVVERCQQNGNNLVVTGTTAIGTLKGIWNSDQEPVPGQTYHVELQIEHPSEIPQSAALSCPWVGLVSDTVLFAGLCEDRDSEVYYLRFDADWLEMLETEVLTTPKKIGDTISFSADWHNITLYPYSLF